MQRKQLLTNANMKIPPQTLSAGESALFPHYSALSTIGGTKFSMASRIFG